MNAFLKKFNTAKIFQSKVFALLIENNLVQMTDQITFDQKKTEGLKYIKEDNYKKAFEIFSLLFYERPKDQELLAISTFLFKRILDGNYDFQPETGEEFIYRGVAKFYKGELTGSIADFDQAIKLNSTLDYAYKCKGFSLMYLKKYSSAIDEFQKAIRINPQGEYYDDIAESYSRMGKGREAILYHEKAIEKAPSDARLWYNYGVLLGQMNMTEEAVIKLQKAIELYPNYEDAKHNLKYYGKQREI